MTTNYKEIKIDTVANVPDDSQENLIKVLIQEGQFLDCHSFISERLQAFVQLADGVICAAFSNVDYFHLNELYLIGDTEPAITRESHAGTVLVMDKPLEEAIRLYNSGLSDIGKKIVRLWTTTN